MEDTYFVLVDISIFVFTKILLQKDDCIFETTMYYIIVVFVQDSNFAGIRVGLTDEELKLCISETTLSGGKIMRQSFRPKIAGRGIEQNAMDFFQMKKKGKEIAAKTANRPQFMDGLGI